MTTTARALRIGTRGSDLARWQGAAGETPPPPRGGSAGARGPGGALAQGSLDRAADGPHDRGLSRARGPARCAGEREGWGCVGAAARGAGGDVELAAAGGAAGGALRSRGRSASGQRADAGEAGGPRGLGRSGAGAGRTQAARPRRGRGGAGSGPVSARAGAGRFGTRGPSRGSRRAGAVAAAGPTGAALRRRGGAHGVGGTGRRMTGGDRRILRT